MLPEIRTPRRSRHACTAAAQDNLQRWGRHVVRSSAEIVQENRDYTLFPWSVQSTADPIHMVRSQGVWFWDGSGNKWLDLCSQLVSLNIGHQHPKVVAAIKQQAEQLCYAGPGFATESRGALGKRLAAVTGLAKAFYCNGGTEANESALKIARTYTGRQKIISRYRSYHGDTMGSMSVGGDFRRWPVEPGVPGTVRVFDPYCYRCPFGVEVEACGRQCVTHVEEVIQIEGPGNVAAMIVEGITGSNGVLVPPDDYFPKLRALLDKYDILMIDDEVMAGFGRTGKWLATQHYGIKPDIVTCAKGLTSGYQPLGAVIVSKEIAQHLETNMLWTGLTFSGHPVSCAAALATLAAYEDEHIFANVELQGAHLSTRLEAMRKRYSCVGDVRYKGLFSVLELVRDKRSKEPLAPYAGTSPEMSVLTRHLRSRCVHAFARFNMCLIAPPLIITREELDYGLDIVEDGLALVDQALTDKESEQ
jgi:taurine--2-oxoglutarate transaminase